MYYIQRTKHERKYTTFENELSHDMTNLLNFKTDFTTIVSNYRNNETQQCLKSALQHNLFKTYTKSLLISTLDKTLTLYIRKFEIHN